MPRRASVARSSLHKLPSWAAAISIAGFVLTGGGYAAAAAAKGNHPRQAPAAPVQSAPAQPAAEAKPAATPTPAPAGDKRHEAASSSPAAPGGPRDQAARRHGHK